MANYGQLDTSPSHGATALNGHHHQNNGHHLSSSPVNNSSAAARQIQFEAARPSRSCCGLSPNFIVYVLFIFNFIFLTSGAVMLVTTVFYRSGSFGSIFGEDAQMSAIRSLLPFVHPLNLVHYATIICGLLICTISVITLFVSCRRMSSGEGGSRSSSKDKKKRISQEEEFDMEIASDDEDEEDDLDGFAGLAVEEAVRRKEALQAKRNRRKLSEASLESSMSTCFLCFFIFALLFLFTIQLTIAMVGFVSVSAIMERQQQSGTINATSSFLTGMSSPLLESIRDGTGTTDNAAVLSSKRSAFDSLEKTFKCCGLTDFKDYPRKEPVPSSCCKTRSSSDCGVRRHPSNIFYDGCVDKLDSAIREQLLMLGSLALGLSFVEVFGLLFACCLYVQLVSGDKTTTVTEARL